MTINVCLLKHAGFRMNVVPARLSLGESAQNQQFQDFQIQNGYGSATRATITPGYGATVNALIDITVNSITEQTFNQIINEVKASSKYRNQSDFKQLVDNSSYATAGSSSSGIFGWLLGGGSSSYNNQTSHLTNAINSYNQEDASSDAAVANSVANIMVQNVSKVHVVSTVQVTGQLLVPQPTVIAVETTTFQFKDQNGNSSSVSLLNQTPLVPVNASDSTVSQNTVSPGAKLVITPVGS